MEIDKYKKLENALIVDDEFNYLWTTITKFVSDGGGHIKWWLNIDAFIRAMINKRTVEKFSTEDLTSWCIYCMFVYASAIELFTCKKTCFDQEEHRMYHKQEIVLLSDDIKCPEITFKINATTKEITLRITPLEIDEQFNEYGYNNALPLLEQKIHLNVYEESAWQVIQLKELNYSFLKKFFENMQRK